MTTDYDALTRCSDCGQRLTNVDGTCSRCDAMCANCMQALRQHYIVNHADGPFVGNGVLLCPTSIFYPKVKVGQ